LKRVIIFGLFFLALSAAVYCAEASRIELSDGSVINGEITSYIDGVYTINSKTFGEIKLESAKVSKIESVNPPATSVPVNPAAGASSITSPGIEDYRQKVMNNPQNAAVITGLAADPQIQELVKDPQISNAAKAGDIQALMKNEKFMSIVNNSKLQEAVKKLKQ
jgi:hypothetical protein